jgi:hypothetical protein
MPYLAGAIMLVVAFSWRNGDTAPPRVGISIACGSIATLIAIAYALLVGGFEALRLVGFLPLMLALAVAEEIIFRDELPADVRSLALWGSLRSGREPVVIVVAQAAFTATHIPRLAFNSELRTVILGLAATFVFGCLMALLRKEGATTSFRALYHALANVAALVAPTRPWLYVVLMLAVTSTFLMAFVAVKIGSATFTPGASRPDLPSVP